MCNGSVVYLVSGSVQCFYVYLRIIRSMYQV